MLYSMEWAWMSGKDITNTTSSRHAGAAIRALIE
jgi:hypothetical protein